MSTTRRNPAPRGRPALAAAAWLFAALLLPTAAPAADSAETRASELMARKQYNDAVRLLRGDLAAAPANASATKYLLLGESYYLLDDYANARPAMNKVLELAADPRHKTIAEYRLACVAYRTNQSAEAAKRIADFIAAHPDDARVGTLLAFRMRLLAGGGPGVREQMEAARKQINSDVKKYGYAVAMVADNTLCDYYIRIKQPEAAKELYAKILYAARGAISEYIRDRRAVPASFERAHDNAALQLGAISLEENQLDEAQRHLENVRYDQEFKQKARLLLAQIAYRKGDFAGAIGRLTADGFLDTVPAGTLRSNMCLLLGLAERSRPNGDPAKVTQYLEQVAPQSEGYFQARFVLGELYRDKGMTGRAIAAFTAAAAGDKYKYAADAAYQLGVLHEALAGEREAAAEKSAAYRKAAEYYVLVLQKHPRSAVAAQARQRAVALQAKGLDVNVPMADDQMLALWNKTVASAPGSPQAAAALLSIAKLHHKTIADSGSGKLVKAPHYAACAAAADKLLDPKQYSGKGLERGAWDQLRGEALYYRGLCELASVAAPPPDPAAKVQPVYLPRAKADKAVELLDEAAKLVDPKQLDLVKGVELGLLEALFKSDAEANRERAEKLFERLADEYGSDPRLQGLAIELAEWYRRQNRFAEAAREYRGVARRGRDLPREDTVKLLYTAGILYSRAADEARADPGRVGQVVTIYPRSRLPLADPPRSDRRLGRVIHVAWPRDGRNLSAAEGVTAISKAAGVPFVWSPATGPGTLADYLAAKRLDAPDGDGTALELLDRVLDRAHHHMAYDVGVTGGTPTIPTPSADPQDPESDEAPRTIEIYDARLWAQRFRPLTASYGAWNSIHGAGKREMLYNILNRIEQLAKVKIQWADGVDSRTAQAEEFTQFPGLDPAKSCSLAVALEALLGKLNLRYQIEERSLARELYGQAKDCFNEIRKIDPRSDDCERALFALALNFYNQREYEWMKIVLREYLKIFDEPGREHYHEANFWIGWTFERERVYRSACHYYARSAEERLVIYRPAADEQPRPAKELIDSLSYDSAYALAEPCSGQLVNAKLNDLVEFIRLNSHVQLALDPSAAGVEAVVNRPRFADVPCRAVLLDALGALGLSFRVENFDPATAEKAYYRLASAYHKDGLDEQALASCSTLLRRFPQTARRRDACKLKLEIYKSLKDYRNVLATLAELKAVAADTIEAFRLDFEIGQVYYDLCCYRKAADVFAECLRQATQPAERLTIRDAYARALLRAGDNDEALHQYEALVKEETRPLRLLIDKLTLHQITTAIGSGPQADIPPEAWTLVKRYEALSAAERAQVNATDLAGVTWVYYTAALDDLAGGRTAAAIEKLNAAANSPDDALAAEAIFRLGSIHMAARDWRQAVENFEYLLFATRATDAQVRATYALGACLAASGQAPRARERFDQLIGRYPISPYVELIARNFPPPAPATAPGP